MLKRIVSVRTPSARLARGFASKPSVVAASKKKAGAASVEVSGIASAAQSYPATRVSHLDNGLKVATERTFGETATVGLWIDAGSRYEDAKSHGVAHLLEHLSFKRNPKVESEIENLGGQLTASVSREQTSFSARILKGAVAPTVELLSSAVRNTDFKDQDVDAAKEAVLNEIKAGDDNIPDVIFDKLHETAFRTSSLGRNVIGTSDSVRSLTRQKIADYASTNFTGANIVLVGAGNVDHEQLVELAKQHLGSVPASTPRTVDTPFFTGSELRIRHDALDYGHVAIAFETGGATDPDYFPALLIQTMIGSFSKDQPTAVHSTSALVAELAGEKLANSSTSFFHQYAETGLLGVYLTADPEGQTYMMNAVMREFVGFAVNPDAERLEHAKTQLKLNVLQALGSTSATAEQIGSHLLSLRRRVHPAEIIARIDAVDTSAIKNAAQRFFYDKDFALSAAGPIYELPDYNHLRGRTWWRRI